ncbi:hypothetical protein Rhow_005644 [Rhodococcus wratislaviensis]|uniref:Uncharacterized protein n=1 Tax=Rhodococcus wratislaviensis TaxID=44752 RepID=A0A402CEG3_RHOWR|nr:hypothetical protein Rhow_005644 [Rhodococcus wratislaviensis]
MTDDLHRLLRHSHLLQEYRVSNPARLRRGGTDLDVHGGQCRSAGCDADTPKRGDVRQVIGVTRRRRRPSTVRRERRAARRQSRHARRNSARSLADA